MPAEPEIPASPDPAAGQTIYVAKVAFSFLSLDVHGLLEVFFNGAHYKIERINAIVDFNQRVFEVNPSLPWREFEARIIALICERGFNFRLSNDLRRRLDEEINYRKFEEYQLLVKAPGGPGLEDFFRSLLSTLYNAAECKLILETQTISEAEFAERAADEEVVLVDEDGQAAEAAETIIEGELVLAPLFGVPIGELAVGDQVRVRPWEKGKKPSPYTKERPEAQLAFIKSVIHDVAFGHTVFAELRPGVLVRCIETEDVLVQAVQAEHRPAWRRLVGTFFNWYLLAFIAIFAVLLLFVIN